jgi:hypothetical protein
MRNPTSSGSRMGTRNRTIDRAPRSPRESGSDSWTAMKSSVIDGLRRRKDRWIWDPVSRCS